MKIGVMIGGGSAEEIVSKAQDIEERGFESPSSSKVF